MLNALSLPSRVVVIPISRPGSWRIRFFPRHPIIPKAGPPKFISVEIDWPSAITTSAPYSPGGFNPPSDTGQSPLLTTPPSDEKSKGRSLPLGREHRRKMGLHNIRRQCPGQLWTASRWNLDRQSPCQTRRSRVECPQARCSSRELKTWKGACRGVRESSSFPLLYMPSEPLRQGLLSRRKAMN